MSSDLLVHEKFTILGTCMVMLEWICMRIGAKFWKILSSKVLLVIEKGSSPTGQILLSKAFLARGS